jgi:hypothetical protein
VRTNYVGVAGGGMIGSVTACTCDAIVTHSMFVTIWYASFWCICYSCPLE